MTHENLSSIQVLVLTTCPNEHENAIQFLKKRQCDVAVFNNLRQALGIVVQKRPDWIFLSVNLGAAAEKYAELLQQSFNITPILFGDVLDRTTIARLSQSTCPTMTSFLSGPNIMMKIRQLLNDEQSDGQTVGPSRGQGSATGPKKADFGFIHLKEKRPNRSFLAVEEGPKSQSFAVTQSGPSAVPGSSVAGGPKVALGPSVRAAVAVEVATIAPSAAKISDENPTLVESLNVMVLVGKEMSGYLLIGSSLADNAAKLEAQKLRKNMSPLIGTEEKMDEKLFGTFKVKIKGLLKWANERSKLVSSFPSEQGEVLTCFLPDPKPLPIFQANQADKYEVRLEDIPTGAPVPCPIYIYLPANKKHVCMIRANSQMSETQQERLLKMGVSHLLIDKADMPGFNFFFIQEKLFRSREPMSA